jgi:ACT domain-containing protein
MTDEKASQICIVTVTGRDKVGIVAKLATVMAQVNINIVDINQKILDGTFVMTMAVDIAKAALPMDKIKARIDKAAHELDLRITIQHENIFKAMHRV